MNVLPSGGRSKGRGSRGVVGKLQAELQADRGYTHALEEHVKTLKEAE